MLRNIIISGLLLVGMSSNADAQADTKQHMFSSGYRYIDGKGYDLGQIYVGYSFHLNEHLVLEGQISSGVKNDNVTVNGQRVEVSSDVGYGAFIKGRYPFGRIGSDFFVRLGYEDLATRINDDSLEFPDDLSGVALGFGFHVFNFKGGGLKLEYTRNSDVANSFHTSYVLGF